jgi:hypothetical protein
MNQEEFTSLLETMPVFIIGNGLSRKDIDVHKLAGKGLIIGFNRFWSDHDLSGYPAAVTIVDTPALVEFLRYPQRDEWLLLTSPFGKKMAENKKYKYRGLQFNEEQTLVLQPRPRKSVSTGHFIWDIVLGSKAPMIFVAGFADPIRSYEGRATDNMYNLVNDGPLKGIRTYTRKTQSMIGIMDGRLNPSQRTWLTMFIEQYMKEGQDRLFRINDTGLLSQIPYVKFNDLVESLPSIFRAKLKPRFKVWSV